MKTILVVYTHSKLNKKEANRKKKYAFNHEGDLKLGDLFTSGDYDSPMQVVKILDKAHTYFNRSTGEMSDTFNSTDQWDIRTLVIREEDEGDIVYGTKVKEADL